MKRQISITFIGAKSQYTSNNIMSDVDKRSFNVLQWNNNNKHQH